MAKRQELFAVERRLFENAGRREARRGGRCGRQETAQQIEQIGADTRQSAGNGSQRVETHVSGVGVVASDANERGVQRGARVGSGRHRARHADRGANHVRVAARERP